MDYQPEAPARGLLASTSGWQRRVLSLSLPFVLPPLPMVVHPFAARLLFLQSREA